MRILIITSNWYGGGAETVAREAYKFYVEKGHEVIYAYSRGDIPEDVNAIKIEKGFDVFTHGLKARIFDGNGFGGKRATRRFIKEIEKINPDIIQIHNIVCYTLNLEILFGFLRKRQYPIVWTLHDCWSFTGHCIFFDDVECNNWKKGCENCLGQKEYPVNWGKDRAAVNFLNKKKILSDIETLTLVTPSIWLSKIVKTTYLREYPIKIINNGIDIEKFSGLDSNLRGKYFIGDRKIVLGVASKWTKRKGLKYFIELESIIDHDSYQLVLIGVDKKQKKEIGDSIITINRTNTFEELIAWYSEADVFVNTSEAENFPTVNLEALACGTPVVTFNTGGSWESVGEEVGELVKEKDVVVLYDAIKRCVARRITPEQCKEHAQIFDRKECFSKYLVLYKDIINSIDEREIN